MNYINLQTISEILGFTVLHFLWQGTVVAIIMLVILAMIRKRTSNEKYIVCCAGMAMMIIAPIITFAYMLFTNQYAVAGSNETAIEYVRSTLTTDWTNPYLSNISLCWIIGTIVFQIRFAFNWFVAHRLRTVCVIPSTLRWQKVANQICDKLHIKQHVRVLESSLAKVPAMIGHINPVILLPEGVANMLSAEQIRSIIAHELAHIRRHDYLINLAQVFVESLLFFHPAVWWLSSKLRTEREYCCDDLAIQTCGNALDYAKALSSLEEWRSGDYRMALASTGGSLMDRIYRILGVEKPYSRRAGSWVTPTLAALSLTAAASFINLTASASSPYEEAAAANTTNASMSDDELDKLEADIARLEQKLADIIATRTEKKHEAAPKQDGQRRGFFGQRISPPPPGIHGLAPGPQHPQPGSEMRRSPAPPRGPAGQQRIGPPQNQNRRRLGPQGSPNLQRQPAPSTRSPIIQKHRGARGKAGPQRKVGIFRERVREAIAPKIRTKLKEFYQQRNQGCENCGQGKSPAPQQRLGQRLKQRIQERAPQIRERIEQFRRSLTPQERDRVRTFVERNAPRIKEFLKRQPEVRSSDRDFLAPRHPQFQKQMQERGKRIREFIQQRAPQIRQRIMQENGERIMPEIRRRMQQRFGPGSSSQPDAPLPPKAQPAAKKKSKTDLP